MDLVVLDEIGKMELFSKLFQDLVCITLDSDKQVLASVPLKGNQFTREIKNRSDISQVFNVDDIFTI